jgi:hypothetical protein
VTEGAKARRGEQVEAVRTQVGGGRRSINELVDCSPERLVPHATKRIVIASRRRMLVSIHNRPQ